MVPETWTVLRILKWTEDYFRKHLIDQPRLDAELLLAHLLGMERLQLYLQFDRPLSEKERADYKVMVRRRVAHEPVQYITGEAFFFGLKFTVNNAVLIPRPETELLVEKAIEIIKNGNVTRVIDIGTGSGAIACSVAHFVTGQKVQASDMSPAALSIARQNAASLKIDAQIEFRQGDLLEPWMADIQPQDTVLILANLPYVREREWTTLEPEVKDSEPREALVSGIEGVDHYQRLIEQISKLDCPCTVIMEMGIEQTSILTDIIMKNVPLASVHVIKDLAQKDRFIFMVKK